MSFWDPTDEQLLHLVTVYLQPWAILWALSIQPKFRQVQLGKVVHLKRLTSFYDIFPVGLNRSIEFWTEISGNFG